MAEARGGRKDLEAEAALAEFADAAPSDPSRLWGAPRLRPGVVVHEAQHPVEGLLAEFALTLRDRGFRVAGLVQTSQRRGSGTGEGCTEQIEYFDLGASKRGRADRVSLAALLNSAIRAEADLVVLGRFPSCLDAVEKAAAGLSLDAGRALPLLATIPGGCIAKWLERAAPAGAMLAADSAALWAWWGPENLYRDLSVGVADVEVRRVVCGERWVMVEGPHGTGLGYLPTPMKNAGRLAAGWATRGLSALARGICAWDPLEAALGLAAVNAHYNRCDLKAAAGNGARGLARARDRVVVVGAFPGVRDILPDAAIVETEPRPGEHPPARLDALIGASDAVVVNASTLVTRTLPRILRQSRGRPLALIGPATPMTTRLGNYGVNVMGGLIVSDAEGLARAVRAGARAREFARFGRYAHVSA
jgi:hypothetical protein